MNPNNLNMANAMNAMNAQMAAGNTMGNNGVAGGQRMAQGDDKQRKALLNTYIYEYFLTNDMHDCARQLIGSGVPINLRRRDANGNPIDGDDEDSKNGLDMKRPDDLPAPALSDIVPESCFLYEWWCLFWDIFNAQRGRTVPQNVRGYIDNTQTQSRLKQDQQQNMFRAMNHPGMMGMRNGPNGMGQNEIARRAMQNNNRNLNPQQQLALQQQQAKQQQMQRDGSDMDGNRQRPGSPENAASPSKRPRPDGPGFTGPQGMVPNGRGQPQGIPGQQVGTGPGGNAAQNAMMLNGMNPNTLTAQQFQDFPGQSRPGMGGTPKGSIQQYANNLAQHQSSQMPNKGMPQPGGPQGQGSPMMAGQEVANYYNADMGQNGIQRGVPNSGPSGGGALQDYQMQLMLLEQQNKKRLLMARQEQDTMHGPGQGPIQGGGMPMNAQFQPGTSPQGQRGVNSPNPVDLKRGTPQMSNTGVPSPEGQARGSPSTINFMPNNMEVGGQFYGKANGIDGNAMAGMPNGIRPPSSHPAGFNGQMNPQQMAMARQQQQQQQSQQPGWPGGPNVAPMMQQQGSQQGGPTPQPMGTPQQRAMPPPQVPNANATANGRTQPSSPQQPAAPPTPSQGNKANPKAKKEAKPKRPAKKAAAASATPVTTENPAGAAPPTPQTPDTPLHPQNFNKTAVQNNAQVTNTSQPAAPVVSQSAPVPQPQPDPLQNGSTFMDDTYMNVGGVMSGMEFANLSNTQGDVLEHFDFDSFLHDDAGANVESFQFDTSSFMDNEVSAD